MTPVTRQPVQLNHFLFSIRPWTYQAFLWGPAFSDANFLSFIFFKIKKALEVFYITRKQKGQPIDTMKKSRSWSEQSQFICHIVDMWMWYHHFCMALYVAFLVVSHTWTTSCTNLYFSPKCKDPILCFENWLPLKRIVQSCWDNGNTVFFFFWHISDHNCNK